LNDKTSPIFGSIYQDSQEEEIELENKHLCGVFGTKSDSFINSIGFIVSERRTISIVKEYKFELEHLIFDYPGVDEWMRTLQLYENRNDIATAKSSIKCKTCQD